MSSLAFFLFPHHHHHLHHHHNHNHNHKYSSIKHGHHFQHHLFVFPLQSPCKVRAIRTSKFDFSPPDFNDDDDLERRRKKRRPRTNKRQVRWWSDDVNEEDVKSSTSLLDQLVDNLFILQVFKSYGWFLPIILISFLIATGPKAFLMGSGTFFGLSFVIFAYQKLSEWVEGSPKPRKRRKKRSKSGRRNGVFVKEDVLVEESLSGAGNKRRDSQSWVSRNNGSFYDKDSRSEVGLNNFGGWDELVREDEIQTPQKPFRETERLERMMEKQRLSRSMEDRDLPLLLKIMIAVFPFLASWTNDLL